MNHKKLTQNKNYNQSNPDILVICTDQQRFDTIAELGNQYIYTPNLDRLVKRGITFTNAYSTCPVCAPARVVMRTGREPLYNGVHFEFNDMSNEAIINRCGDYDARLLAARGYSTFGIGKFHASSDLQQVDLGFENLEYTDDNYPVDYPYRQWLKQRYPEYAWVESLGGERNDLEHVPQTCMLPACAGFPAWVAERAIHYIENTKGLPYYGFISFIGPHEPYAPPIPFNRMYEPGKLPLPLPKNINDNEMPNEEIGHWLYTDMINDQSALSLKARYYGSITYIDLCIGMVLDAVERRGNSDNTLIIFTSDHGDMLGDCGLWQKFNYYEPSARIPLLVSWPARLAQNEKCGSLAGHADFVATLTAATGEEIVRDGIDLVKLASGGNNSRQHLVGTIFPPGSNGFKLMVRKDKWKYIFSANGGTEQLYNMSKDSLEKHNSLEENTDVVNDLRAIAVDWCDTHNAAGALDDTGRKLRAFPEKRFIPSSNPARIHFFETRTLGITGYPEHPRDVFIPDDLLNFLPKGMRGLKGITEE